MKKLILLMLIVSIIVIACDRFEREFETVDEFRENFTVSATNYLRNDDIESLMTFYSDMYKNNGVSKDSLATIFASRNWSEQAEIIVTSIPGQRTRFNIEVRDSEFTVSWSDVIRLEAGNYIWYGNQMEPIEARQVVIAQVFTALHCANCPNASEALHTIAMAFPYNFIYLKCHVGGDSLSNYSNFREESVYYSSSDRIPQPTVVFQGQTTIIGGTSAQTERYPQVVQDFIAQDAAIVVNDLKHSVNNRTITGSVVLNFTTLNPENLYLYYVVYEKETTATYESRPTMHAGNVVRARGSQPLNNLWDGQRIDFEFESTRHLGDDTYLVVWVQRIQDINRRSDSDAILNAIRQKLR